MISLVSGNLGDVEGMITLTAHGHYRPDIRNSVKRGNDKAFGHGDDSLQLQLDYELPGDPANAGMELNDNVDSYWSNHSDRVYWS